MPLRASPRFRAGHGTRDAQPSPLQRDKEPAPAKAGVTFASAKAGRGTLMPYGGVPPLPAAARPPSPADGERVLAPGTTGTTHPPAALPAPIPWRRFVAAFATAVATAALALSALVVGLDPYGFRAGPGRAPAPIMDVNQRYMDPQIVRSGRYDAAVFGTSTVRLLDPRALGAAFGARFANLGFNAGSPWEQTRIADLFLRHARAPRVLLLGIDASWCEADADQDAKRRSPYAFPAWLYDADPVTDYARLLNLTSLEIATRVALHRVGLLRERVRPDGYHVFTPPEGRYDLERARAHIWQGSAGPLARVEPPVRLAADERAALAFPALSWLDALLGRVPPGAAVILALMPVHVAAQPVPGSREEAIAAECKARIAEIGARRNATVVDFRLRSPVTGDDANYWDPLHYRLPVAERIVAALRAAQETRRDAPDGFYKVLAAPTDD